MATANLLILPTLNFEKVRVIIAPVIEDYKSGKITCAEAEFNARTKIYQSVKPDFNPDVEYMKDPLSRDTFRDSIRITDKELHEDLYTERSSITRKLKAYRKQQQEQTYPKPRQKELDDEIEL